VHRRTAQPGIDAGGGEDLLDIAERVPRLAVELAQGDVDLVREIVALGPGAVAFLLELPAIDVGQLGRRSGALDRGITFGDQTGLLAYRVRDDGIALSDRATARFDQ
jgi:hypothetical protein